MASRATSEKPFYIKWGESVKPEFSGITGKRPLHITASGTTPSATVHLYAADSESFPNENRRGWWESLLPTWRFVNEDGKTITSLTMSGTKKSDGTYSYSGDVWFIDDMPSKKRVNTYLYAVLETSAIQLKSEHGWPSYANSRVKDIVIHRTAGIWPDEIRYTTDGLSALSGNYHWTNQIIPFIGTAHSSYYELIKDDKKDIGSGILFDFPNTSGVDVAFSGLSLVARDKISEETGDYKTSGGKRILDEEGEPIPITVDTYIRTYAPITRYEDLRYVETSGYLQTSSDHILIPESDWDIIPNSSATWQAPAFSRIDDRKNNNFYIGGYFIGNLQAPDFSRAAGETFTGSAETKYANDAYLPPFSIWVSAPYDGLLYRISPNGDCIEPEEGPSGFTWASTLATSDKLEKTPNVQAAYHTSGVHGVYCFALDLNYDAWMVDGETAKLYKYNAYGERLSAFDLNEQFRGLASADPIASSLYFPADKRYIGIEPSWLAYAPFGKERIYIGYHNSYLITTHDKTGKMLEYDISNPLAYRGSLEEIDRNVQDKGFHAYVDNANKPTEIVVGKTGDVWVGYTSTSVGYDSDRKEISEEDETKICVYKNGEIHHDQSPPTMSFPLGTSIVSMCRYDGKLYVLTTDYQNNSEFFSLEESGGRIVKSTIVSGGGFLKSPGHITISSDGIVWFHHKIDTLCMYDTKEKYFYEFSDDLYPKSPDSKKNFLNYDRSGYNVNDDLCEIDGMEIDTDDYLWVVDNYATNNIHRIDTRQLRQIAYSMRLGADDNEMDLSVPPGKIKGEYKKLIFVKGMFNPPPEPQYNWKNVKDQPDEIDVPFLLAEGDWTGIKLQIALNEQKPDYMVGNSGKMMILNYDNFRFRKFNETWDIIDAMKSCILVPKFAQSSKTFWDEYAKSMVGGVDNHSYPIGRRLHERIANIVPNLHDVEDSTINGLYSMAHAQDVPMNNYDLHYPEAAQRIADLFSCRHERIWGERCHCNENYTVTQKAARDKTHYCQKCNHWHKTNLGPEFDIGDRNLVTDKRPYVVKNNMDHTSNFLRIEPSDKSVADAIEVLNRILNNKWDKDDTTVAHKFYHIPEAFAASIKELTSWNAQLMAIHTQFYVTDMWFNYCFWEFLPRECEYQDIGLVNWDDKYTTFPESMSGIEEFYANPSPQEFLETGNLEGIAQLTFNWILHNGLMFGKDGYEE